MTTTTITKADFYKRLKDANFGDKPLTVDFEVLITNELINWHHCKIIDVVFKEKVVIRDCEINSGIFFSNSKFDKGIVFHNVKSTNYNSSINPDSFSISFVNCNAKFIVFEKQCIFARSVVISDNCIVEKVSINETLNQNGGFNIRKSKVNYLDISTCKTDLTLSNSTFNNMLRLENLFGNVSLIKNSFNDNVMFWNIECSFSLTTNYNVFKDTFKIDGSRIKRLSLIGDTFEKKAEFENRDLSGNNLVTYLNNLYIAEAKFIEGIDFNGLGKSLDELKLVVTPELTGVLNFDNWIVEKTIISGINQNLKLLFKSIKFRFLFINEFTNYSDISFDRCRGNGNEAILNLINSDLGSTRFNEFDLKSFKVLRLNNVSIDKIRPSNVIWFKDSQVEIEVHEQTDSEKARRKREIYRQLKQALKNHGNQIDSLIFQARELKCLRDEFKKSDKYSWGERLIMTVSQSNDYGLNWRKPAGIVFLITFLLYLLVLPGISNKILFSPALSLEDLHNTYNIFTSNFKTFWNLFNPVRRIDLTYGDYIQTDWIYFLDLLHRVFLGIMIFQIIKAFRKYVSN